MTHHFFHGFVGLPAAFPASLHADGVEMSGSALDVRNDKDNHRVVTNGEGAATEYEENHMIKYPQAKMPGLRPIFALLLLLLMATGVAAASARATDEFVGPFANWMNIKRDFGAVGDGKADDTAAIQRGLEAVRMHTRSWVLYFPAGVYRITRTLKLLRNTDAEAHGISIYGEDPETAIIKWDGPADGVMFFYNPWYSGMERLTFDGGGKAKTAIQHGERFATANEFSDLIFKDVRFGIEAGIPLADGVAETQVSRCRFYRCAKAGISIQNFNSLDWYIWNNWFEDCGIGVANEFGAGNFYIYQCTFLRSTVADVSIKHTGYFTLCGNTSIGSRAFFLAKRHQIWQDSDVLYANLTLQKNDIYSPHDATPIRVEDNGPLLLLDNVIRTTSAGPVASILPTAGKGDLLAIGNTFTASSPLKANGRVWELDDIVSPRLRRSAPALAPLPFPPRARRQIIEVPAHADTALLQAALTQAAALHGSRPVVHLPSGEYAVQRTLTIPEGSDMQFVGDGYYATSLKWTGQEGPLLRILGPTHVTLRNFYIGSGKATTIEAVNVDQPGARVFMEQTHTDGTGYGLVVDGLDHTYVELRAHGHGGVQVLGGAEAAAGKRPAGLTALFCGGSGRTASDLGINSYNVDRGGRLLVRDIWYEGSEYHFLNLTGSGEFTYHAGLIGPNGPHEHPDIIRLDRFRGKVTMTQVAMEGGRFYINGGKETSVLGLGLGMENAPLEFEKGSVQDKIALLFGHVATARGQEAVPDIGTTSPAFFATCCPRCARNCRAR